MPTRYKLPRPTLCSSSTCTPSVGLLVCMAYTGKVGPWVLQTHEVTFSISAPRTSQRRLLARLAVAVLSLPSSLSPSSRMKFSRHSLLPALDLETGKLQGAPIPSIPVPCLRGTGVARATRSLIIKGFVPGRSVTVPTSGTELYSLTPPESVG